MIQVKGGYIYEDNENTGIKSAQTKQELCKQYNISYKTLRKWLEPIKFKLTKNTRVYNYREMEYIYDHLGVPDEINV